MKKYILIVLCLCFGCSASRPTISNVGAFRNHHPPYQVFGIGYWNRDLMVLTLVDSNHQYFIIKDRRNENLKIGQAYAP